MGVEILILSGARQGEKVVLEADEIRAGGTDACDLFFDPADDVAARGRVAVFRRSEEGWSIQNAGNGELMLNQETVLDRTRIRSGDIVRLSDHGPDFSFEIMTGRASAWADSPPAKTPPRVDTPPPQPAGTLPDESTPVIASDDVLQSGVTAESNLPPIVSPSRSRHIGPMVAAIVGFAAAAVLILSAAGVFSPAEEKTSPLALTDDSTTESKQQPDQKTPPVDVDPPKTSSTPREASDPPKMPVTPPPPVAPQPVTTQTKDDPKPETPPADPWIRIEEKYKLTVWLLQVADPAGKFVYPFATAVAIDRQTLLTTATVAAELHKFNAQGWKLQARNTALKKTVGLGNIRLHALYATFGDDPQKKIYVDLGVLTTRQPLSVVSPMATAAELAMIDTGTRLACMGILHQGDAIKITDLQSQDALVPEMIACKLFLRTQFDPKSPSSPRLLHLKASPSGDLNGNLYGSPIIDPQGRIVAIYAEAAAMGEGKQLRLHYATMIEPAVLQRAISAQPPGGNGAKLWIPPIEIGKKKPQRSKNSNGSKK